MPSSMTHTYFGCDVLEKLPQYCKNKINGSLEYYKLFCQGSDPFMFYRFFIGKKSKEGMRLQNMMHSSYTRDFFIHTIEYIHRKKYDNCSEVMAYLYGYICHYYLDLYAHPFISYQAGVFDKNDKLSYMCQGAHQRMEYDIDLYMILEREKIKPYRFKVYQHIFDVKSFTNPLIDVIDYSVNQTYHQDHISSFYLSSVKYMKNFFKFFNYDPLGLKLKLYQLIDFIKPRDTIPLEILSFHHLPGDWLNLEHDKWCFPWDNSVIFTSSFFDLYDMALSETVKSITLITDMLSNDKVDYKLLHSIFKDLSYSTGQDWHQQPTMKYYKYKKNLL